MKKRLLMMAIITSFATISANANNDSISDAKKEMFNNMENDIKSMPKEQQAREMKRFKKYKADELKKDNKKKKQYRKKHKKGKKK